MEKQFFLNTHNGSLLRTAQSFQQSTKQSKNQYFVKLH
jgi:hypothetical protein